MHGREGGRARGGVALLLVGSQQYVKKLKKIDYNVFFFAAGGLTDCIHTARCCFWGIAWLSILFVVVVVVFLFSFFRNVAAAAAAAAVAAAAAAAVAVRRRRPSNTYLTCRVADFTTLGTLVMKPLMNTMNVGLPIWGI